MLRCKLDLFLIKTKLQFGDKIESNLGQKALKYPEDCIILHNFLIPSVQKLSDNKKILRQVTLLLQLKAGGKIWQLLLPFMFDASILLDVDCSLSWPLTGSSQT